MARKIYSGLLRNRVYALFVFLIIGHGSLAQSARQADSSKLRELSRTKFEWMVNKDIDRWKALLDGQLLYIHSNGWIETSQDVINDIETKKLSALDLARSSNGCMSIQRYIPEGRWQSPIALLQTGLRRLFGFSRKRRARSK